MTAPSSPDAWGGIRGGDHATLSERVASYRISATLDPDKHVIAGQQQLTWRNRSAVLVRSVYIHLYMNAFEGEGSSFFTEQRQRGERFRSGAEIGDGEWGHIALRSVTQGGAVVPWRFVQPDGGPATDHTVARLDLPEAVAPGASTTLEMAFTTGVYIAITVLGMLVAGALAVARLNVPALGSGSFLGGLLLAQLAVLALAWMRCARLFGLMELARGAGTR